MSLPISEEVQQELNARNLAIDETRISKRDGVEEHFLTVFSPGNTILFFNGDNAGKIATIGSSSDAGGYCFFKLEEDEWLPDQNLDHKLFFMEQKRNNLFRILVN